VHQKAAAALQQAADVEERAGDIDVRDVHVPMLVGQEWLLENPFF
jgi:hypothetical protein